MSNIHLFTTTFLDITKIYTQTTHSSSGFFKNYRIMCSMEKFMTYPSLLPGYIANHIS